MLRRLLPQLNYRNFSYGLRTEACPSLLRQIFFRHDYRSR
jgi:hypothetical protein